VLPDIDFDTPIIFEGNEVLYSEIHKNFPHIKKSKHLVCALCNSEMTITIFGNTSFNYILKCKQGHLTLTFNYYWYKEGEEWKKSSEEVLTHAIFSICKSQIYSAYSDRIRLHPEAYLHVEQIYNKHYCWMKNWDEFFAFCKKQIIKANSSS
jgi:hypothetical protein